MTDYKYSFDKKMKFRFQRGDILYFECENKCKRKCPARMTAELHEGIISSRDYKRHSKKCKDTIFLWGNYYL